MDQMPEVLLPLSRILAMIASPPNARREPLPEDPDISASFYFDGGACVEITGGGSDYYFADGTEARVSPGYPWSPEAFAISVTLGGRTFTLREAPLARRRDGTGGSASICCLCGTAIGIGQTHQLTAAGPAHLACPRP
jgi:hypothetical protein